MALPDNDVLNKLTYTFEWAALDISARDIKRENEGVWKSYVSSLPPSKLLKVFSDSLDYFVSSAPADRNFLKLDPQESEKVFMAWQSLTAASNAVSKALQFGFKDREQVGSDIGRSIYFAADLVKSIDPVQGQVWEDRGTAYKEEFSGDSFDQFLDRMFSKARKLESLTPR
jgi:hypothetical protein